MWSLDDTLQPPNNFWLEGRLLRELDVVFVNGQHVVGHGDRYCLSRAEVKRVELERGFFVFFDKLGVE